MRRKTPSGKGVYKNTHLLLIGFFILISGLLTSTPKSYAHFAHLAHYNNGGMGLGNTTLISRVILNIPVLDNLQKSALVCKILTVMICTILLPWWKSISKAQESG